MRERGASQAPPLKRRREKDRSIEKNMDSERIDRSLEVERERDQRQRNTFTFTSTSFKSTQNIKTCTDKKRPGFRTKKVMTRHLPIKQRCSWCLFAMPWRYLSDEVLFKIQCYIDNLDETSCSHRHSYEIKIILKSLIT